MFYSPLPQKNIIIRKFTWKTMISQTQLSEGDHDICVQEMIMCLAVGS